MSERSSQRYTWLLRYVFCVLFNDTATTEIYTLSLHDALPICLNNDDVDRFLKSVSLTDGVAPGPGDRKSTRLNSSHGYNSYAVFCLKKKKTRRSPTRISLRPLSRPVARTSARSPHVGLCEAVVSRKSGPAECSTGNFFFFFNDTATTEIYTLSLHDALPISPRAEEHGDASGLHAGEPGFRRGDRSEEHTSELQSRLHLVCRLLLEKKKK